ncbi:MAG: hypothetical protein LBD23_19105 [Oscillospiraceae bacterium]|jgi:hypothetical protein|nr:hypothetical protein [Oscillospiraceae bacterium]
MKKLFFILQLTIVFCILSNCIDQRGSRLLHFQGYVYDMLEKTPIQGLRVYPICDAPEYLGPSPICRDIDRIEVVGGGGMTDKHGYFKFRIEKDRRSSLLVIESDGIATDSAAIVTRSSGNRDAYSMFVNGRADTIFIDTTGEARCYTRLDRRRKSIIRLFLISVGILGW